MCAGGANIPALNDLLQPFGAAFGDAVLEGDLVICEDDFGYMSGANIARLPAGSWLHTASMTDKATIGESMCGGRRLASACQNAGQLCLQRARPSSTW